MNLRALSRLRFGLAGKLAVCLVVSALVFSVLFSWANLRLQRRRFEQVVLLSAERIADLIERSARFSMERNDREALYHLIRDIGQEQGVERLRIFNEQGLIRFSTDPTEVNRAVDKQAEQCFACHNREEPLVRLKRPDHARTFTTAAGQRVLAVIRPIENRPACYSCHPSERRILGVIDTHLSLAGVDEQLAQHQRDLSIAATLAAVLLSLSGGVFVWLFVHRPIRRLTQATEQVTHGQLTHRIEVDSNDEIGRLARSFNTMTVEIERSHQELTGWAQTLEDRVQRKTAELQRARDSLVASENLASLGKLAATVAHEVNNPLFGMLTYARLTLKILSNADIDPRKKAQAEEYLHVIERESKRCGDILRSLLEFARHGTSASAAPHTAEADLNSLIERAIKLVDHRLELQQITLEQELRPSLPMVYCDAAQIEQAALALMINAVEAMPDGGLLSVSSDFDAVTGFCSVEIRDTGVGISEENLRQVFEPFFTTKDFRHSTGLGLPIAKGIIERHGGTLEVRSTPGQGTAFRFTIPAHPGADNDGGTAACLTPIKAAS